MQQYLDLLNKLLTEGVESGDRTGTGTLRLPMGHSMSFNLQEGFPLLTTKRLHLKSIIHELLWILSGSTNVKYLQDNGITIWDEWADKNGDLGPVYGHQFRRWQGDPTGLKLNQYALFLKPYDGIDSNDIARKEIDQISNALHLLKTNPDSRRNVVTAWNPADLTKVALAWCHCMFQLLVIDGKVSLILTQRSADTFLGVPFNIASYALLTHMFAQQAGLDVGYLTWNGGDVHLYQNHVEQARLQLSREPRSLPKLVLNKAPDLFSYRVEDFEFVGYNPRPTIKASVSV